jgi:hypothetical protein
MSLILVFSSFGRSPVGLGGTLYPFAFFLNNCQYLYIGSVLIGRNLVIDPSLFPFLILFWPRPGLHQGLCSFWVLLTTPKILLSQLSSANLQFTHFSQSICQISCQFPWAYFIRIRPILRPSATFRYNIFTTRIWKPHAQFSRWRYTPCRFSATDYSIYSQLPSISGGRLFRLQPEDAQCSSDKGPT